MKNRYLILFFIVSTFAACSYPKNEEIVGAWSKTNFDIAPEGSPLFLEQNCAFYSEPSIGIIPVYVGRCNTKADFFKFEADGSFQSTILRCDCLDSIVETGTWEINKKQLEIYLNHNDLIISAKIVKLTSDRLILEPTYHSNSYFVTNWIFWRNE